MHVPIGDEVFMVNFINIEICWLILSKVLIEIECVHVRVCMRAYLVLFPNQPGSHLGCMPLLAKLR